MIKGDWTVPYDTISDWLCWMSIKRWGGNNEDTVVWRPYTRTLVTISVLLLLAHLLLVCPAANHITSLTERFDIKKKIYYIYLTKRWCWTKTTIISCRRLWTYTLLAALLLGNTDLSVNKSNLLSLVAICWGDRAEEEETAALEVVGTGGRRGDSQLWSQDGHTQWLRSYTAQIEGQPGRGEPCRSTGPGKLAHWCRRNHLDTATFANRVSTKPTSVQVTPGQLCVVVGSLAHGVWSPN